MKSIPLNRGQFALVDNRDYEKVMALSWHTVKTPGSRTLYAAHSVYPNKTILLHRFILSAEKGSQVDHKNHNGLDCRRKNLRFVSRGQNIQNSTLYGNNRSGYAGVRWREDRKKWEGQIGGTKLRQYLGLFQTAELAAQAYDRAALRLYGKEAYLNFPERGNDETAE